MGGGKKGKKSKKTKTKAQKMAVANKAKYGGTASAAAANRNRNKTSGIGPVASGKAYAKALSKATNAPSKKTSGVGPVASGSQYASMLKKSPPRFSSGTMAQQKAALSGGTNIAQIGQQGPATNIKQYEDGKFRPYTGVTYPNNIRLKEGYQLPTKTAMLPGDDNLGGPAAILGGVLTIGGMGVNAIKNMKDNFAPKLRENLEKKLNPESQNQSSLGISNALASTGDLTGIGIGSTPNYFSVKSPESFGAPSQAEVDKAAGITAGGLNIGGAGFTPKNFNDPTARVADAYKSTLNPDSFKGLSDGETFGSGPVASGEDYARGLNVDNKNVENIMRSFVKNRLPFIDAIPGVNTRLLTDKEIADKRVKAQKMRKEMMTGRGGNKGTKALAAVPTVIEEILPEALPVPSGSTTPATQTGLDPNKLLQIQQQAYAQAYNPMLIGGFSPQFRFGAATPTIDYSTYFNY